MKSGDQIKLGRIDFRILEIKTENEFSSAPYILNKDINSMIPNSIYDGNADSENLKVIKKDN